MLGDWWKRAAAQSRKLETASASRRPATKYFKPQLEEFEPRIMPSGVWTQVTNPAPDPIGIQAVYLLPNGTVMANGGSNPFVSTSWYALTPDATGSYINGTWSTLASSSLGRLAYTADMLNTDQLFIYGGEDTGPNNTPGVNTFDNTGEIYNEDSNTWSAVQSIPANLNPINQFGDDPSEVLPNGTILAGYIGDGIPANPASVPNDGSTFIYNPATNTWSAGATKLFNDQSDEETWVKLPGGDILSYNLFGNPQTAQRYDPATNTWIYSGAVPDTLQTNMSELGPLSFCPPTGRSSSSGPPRTRRSTPRQPPGAGPARGWLPPPFPTGWASTTARPPSNPTAW